MYNYFLVIGKLLSFSEAKLSLELTKPFKNSDGVFETYTIVIFTGSYLFEILSSIGVGQTISVKGRVKPTDDDNVRLYAEQIICMKEFN